LSAVELMPSTTQRSAPRPPKTRAATGIARTPNSGGIRAKFFNKIKDRKTSSLDRTIGRLTSSAATAVEETTSVAITARWRHKRHRVLRRPKQFDWRAKWRRTRRLIFSDVFSKY